MQTTEVRKGQIVLDCYNNPAVVTEVVPGSRYPIRVTQLVGSDYGRGDSIREARRATPAQEVFAKRQAEALGVFVLPEVGRCYSCGEPISEHDDEGLCEECLTDKLERDGELFAYEMQFHGTSPAFAGA